MESVHGVDVSWLHRPNKEGITRSRAPSSPAAPPREVFSPSPRIPQSPAPDKSGSENDEPKTLSRVVTEPLPNKPASSIPLGTTVTHIESSAPRPNAKRPNLLGRTSSEKLGGDRSPRRGSWISNISSRFSSGSQPNTGSPATPQVSRPAVNGTHVTSPKPNLEKVSSPTSPNPHRERVEELQPYVPQKPKESTGNFFSSITRRLSTNAQNGPAVKVPENGGVCPRRTMNVNPNRARCLVPELDPAKLRRVSFSVDVEIAGGPRYKDEEAPVDKVKKTKDKKLKERAEGEALKRPQAASELKDEESAKDISLEEALANSAPPAEENKDDEAKDEKKEHKVMTRKQEKKKRSEEERKERKEKKRRKAEENGQIPVELTRDDEDDSGDSTSPGSVSSTHPVPPPKPHDRPTTDPVRIYRRCCQLRESPILKRITEQLMSPKCTVPGDPGTVTCLNLTGSRLQLADFITLGDWLAIVPVKRLLLEDADITDEGLRVVLAGLLAAKKPQPTKTRNRNSDAVRPRDERAGVVERLNLKNNTRITRIGWKHMALFLNMCRSIKAIDLSMIQFPEDLPPGAQKLSPRPDGAAPLPDAAEIFAKSLAERQAGSVLEELILSECGLSSEQIRKIVDGAMVCGVSRLGLAGSQLDDDGFEHVLTYIRSGICNVVDIGSNDLNGKLEKLAESLTNKPDCPVWGLSLASCNLDSESLKPLFPALVQLNNFRFLDLSHNKGLFNDTTEGVHLLRKYIPLLKNVKRMHLNDVGMNAKQAIALAEVLPEGPSLAHLAILENAELSKLVANTDEASQEEACALYASLMAAVRVSHTIVCIDVDVPPPNNSEVVKALAKQVVAYCLRNMERMPLPESTSSEAASSLSAPHNQVSAESSPRPENSQDISVPDVLIHLVGHVDGFSENHDNDDPAPDSDYIVGGTGVVKALSYCLGEKAQELRRSSAATGPGGLPSTPGATPSRSGRSTPTSLASADRDAATGAALTQRQGRAKEMSKNLLGSARKIRARLQPALVKEATAGDEMAYRRLLFLDKTLEGMILRFEDEYPECRLAPPGGDGRSPGGASAGKEGSISSFGSAIESPVLNRGSAEVGAGHQVLLGANSAGEGDSDEELLAGLRRPSRRGSEVSLANKALSIEEGRMHRLGHGIRQDLAHGVGSGANSPSRPGTAAGEKGQGEGDADAASVVTEGSADGEAKADAALEGIDMHLKELTRRLDEMSGSDVKELVEGSDGWDKVMEKVGANIEELRVMKQRDPVAWEGFVESQVKARMNVGRREGE
ncbi:hypothetical protein C1H76_4348 [Elsinoe australis]|uniref:RNI-like protein n=1 Tax=Elsinoe australis TaxID=40998 RepID=A0A4U7B1P0_9PEZI|nr:hypothetical protein C1H76_4348 [Elsinoe australis]